MKDIENELKGDVYELLDEIQTLRNRITELEKNDNDMVIQ